MLFQTLDDKAECVGLYIDKKLLFNPETLPSTLSTTWKYTPYLRGCEVEYISLYLEGDSISAHVPEYLQDDWSDISHKLGAFKRSLGIAGVDTQENCFFDLVPQRFLVEMCEIKNKITQHIIDTLPRPQRYQFYKQVSMMVEDMGATPVNLDRRRIRTYLQHPKLGSHAHTLLNCDARVRYNQFGTKTGRLTTKRGTFPILTLNKCFRPAILPRNDFFVELDFNGAEVRTLLGLLGRTQPVEDVHAFHLTHIFKSLSSRDAAKVAFFAWLYGAKASASQEEARELGKFYDKERLLNKYWKDETITTPFKKVIKGVSAHHALNYLVQSTAAELTLKQALKLDYLLRNSGSGSNVAFIIHDSVVLDMKKEDEYLLNSLVTLMQSTNFGIFKINASKGTTLGDMRTLHCG